MRGVPVRIELGPRDIEAGQGVVGIRYNGEKRVVKLNEIQEKLPEIFAEIQKGMFEKAAENRAKNSYRVTKMDEILAHLEDGDCFIHAPWCGEEECEDKIKEQTGVGSRCIPEDGHLEDGAKCVCCGKEAKHMLYWGKAY